mgnify:CR=1 FL=1
MDQDTNKSFTTALAKFISIVFHPLLMPLYGLGIIFTAPTLLVYMPVEVKKLLFLIVFINNVFIPLVLLPFFKNRNLISTYTIEDKKERAVPLIMMSVLYSVTSFVIFKYQIPGFLKSFIFASTILVILVTLINFWYKISIHAVAAGALIAVVALLSLKMSSPLVWYLVSTILTAGLILSSRLKLNSHDPGQVWSGFFTGFAVSGIFFLLI